VLTKLAAERLRHGFVGRVQVAHGRSDVGMASEPLSHHHVPGTFMETGDGGVPQLVKSQAGIQPGFLQPVFEQPPHVSHRNSASLACGKQRHVWRVRTATLLVELKQLGHFDSQHARDVDLLGTVGTLASLENAQRQARPNRTLRREDVTDVQRLNLMQAQAQADRQREDHVFLKVLSVLAAGIQEAACFCLGKRSRWAQRLGEMAHSLSPKLVQDADFHSILTWSQAP